MRSRPIVLRLAAALLAFFLLSSLWERSAILAGEPQWIEVRSPNFSVLTDGGEKRGREVIMRFEQMRAAFATLMTKGKVNLPVPLQIVAFRNTKEIRQVAPLWHGKPTQLAGLFQSGGDRSFIMLDLSTQDPWTTVFHEYAHQLMNGNLQTQIDPWFEEGFAVYFSSIEVDSKEARVGKIPRDDYLILQQIGTMKIVDLFKVQQFSETYNETGNRRTIFYSESGMVVHYIYDNQLLPKVATYFELKVDKHASVEDAIQQAFGMTAPKFDKTLRDYISADRYRYYPIPAPANISEKTYTTRPVALADANAVLADIHLHSPDYQDRAVSEFQEILKTDPNNAAACRGLGYAYLQKQDFSQAGVYFKRASQADSKDPRVHYYNALLIAREGGFSSQADIPELTQELETSISLDPNFADSYALLAFAQTTSGDPAKALENMHRALAIDPRNESYLFNLANIYLANHEPDKAIAVLQSLRNANSPQVAARAATALANVQRFQQGQSATPEMNLIRRDTATTSTALPETTTSSPVSPGKQVKWGPPIFLHGIVSSIDCATEPSALLTVSSGTKTLTLNVTDKAHVILIGADQFSCSWTNKKVAVNYRQNETGETNVISLELQ
jgi:Flp pilus assembly protein TadD